MSKKVVIVHFNTPELTEATICSLNKMTDGCKVYVFDNSDIKPFKSCFSNVEVIDNTHGQVVDFERFLNGFPSKVENRSNWGSAKHCKSVDCCMDLIGDDFLLMDSDVLIKKDVRHFFDKKFSWVGGVHTNTRRFGLEILRVIPFLCYLNVPFLKQNGVRYFNPDKMWFLTDREPDMYYDTGAWLFEETNRKKLPYSIIDINEFALHFRHGSWREKDEHNWLRENKELWM